MVWNKKYADPLIGEKINSWTVLGAGLTLYGRRKVVCRCDCGVERQIDLKDLRTNKTTKCRSCYYKSKPECARRKNSGLWAHRNAVWAQEAVKELYEAQKGLCPVCGKQLPQDLSKCAWDHDHKTGQGRGLLHRGCNTVLGFVENNPEFLARVRQYCEKYNIPI